MEMWLRKLVVKLASSFFCSFSHVHRGGNRLAHALARRAVSSAGLDVWVEELPIELESVFQTDYLNL